MSTETVKIKIRKNIGKIVAHLILAVVMIIILGPLIWMVMGSLKGKVEFYTNVLGLPKQFLWSNYVAAWIDAKLARCMLNSCIVTVSSVIPVVMLASVASYGFARFKFGGNKLLFFVVLVGLMITPQVIVIPLATILARMKLINTHLGIIFAYIAWALPFSIFLLRAFFMSLPQEIIDSAKIDGCSEFGAFWKIALPLSRPGLFPVAIFSGVNIWNDFLFAMIFLRSDKLKTLPIGLTALEARFSSSYTMILAGLTIAVVPIAVLFVIFRGEFMKGLTAGSLKI